MENILHWGIDLINALQSYRTPWLDSFFKIVTELGSEYFYLAALPIIFCLADRRLGTRLFIALCLSVWANSAFKNLLEQPRPFHLAPSVGLIEEHGFGLPSGHAQQALLFWGVLFIYTKQKWAGVMAILMVGLVSFSRVYLGVHFPTDIFAGWILGAAVIGTLYVGEPWVQNMISRITLKGVALVTLLLSIALVLIFPNKDAITVCGFLPGLIMGLYITSQLNPDALSAPQKWLQATLNAVGLMALYFGLKTLFASVDGDFFLPLRYGRYFLCGFWLSVFPFVFTHYLIRAPKSASDRQLS